MKILMLLIITICLNFSPTSMLSCNAEESEKVFAKVQEECTLYKTSDTDLILSSNVFFTIPKGYFVTIITNITSEVVKVSYGAFVGFVKEDKIKRVSGTPKSPTLDTVTFSIKESASTQMRLTPSTEDKTNVLQIIPSGTAGIKFIGKVIGEIPPSGSSNIWYFAEYSPESDPVSVYYGYVYSEKTEHLLPIPENSEFESELVSLAPGEAQEDYIYLSGGIKALLIIIISLPLLIIFLLLLFSNKREKTNENILKGKFIFRKKPQKSVKTDENMPIFPTYDFDDDDLL